MRNNGVLEQVNVVSMGCARRRGIHRTRKRDSRTGADTAPHPRISNSHSLSFSLHFLILYLDFLQYCVRSFVLTIFHSSLFLFSRIRERKNTIVYRVYMAPLYPHVRDVPRLGTAEAEPRGALSLINGTSFRTYNRRPMSTNLSLFFSTTFQN